MSIMAPKSLTQVLSVIALVPLLAVPPAFGAPKPKRDEPTKPELVAAFGDWTVFRVKRGKGHDCYAHAVPKVRAPEAVKRDPSDAFVTTRPGEKVRNEPSFTMGFDVATAEPEKEAKGAKKRAQGSGPSAQIGPESFEMQPKGTNLWVKNVAEESRFIDEIKKGIELKVSAASKKGNVMTDAYSLKGFAPAIERLQKECPAG